MVNAAEQPAGSAETALLTFLIADIRGYTSFTVGHGDEAGARLATRFAEITEEIVTPRGGRVVELRGDEALAVFPSVRQALRAALDLQERFAGEMRADASLPLRVGIGIDAGEAIPVPGGFRGAALNLAARLCSLAGAGEILASQTVANLARKMEGVAYADRGAVELKGFADRVPVVQVTPESAAPGEEVPTAPSGARPPEQVLPIGGFLGSLPATPLIAREDELNRALESVEAVQGGSGRLLLLSGEPGIGKTRLAQEITLNARNRGFLIASGRCYEPEGTVPYYPFREALSMLFDAAPPDIRSQTAARWPYLLQLLPEADVSAHQMAGGTQEDQQRLFYAVTGFVQAVAAAQPVAVLLDDLHWADESSLKLLQHLARHARTSAVLVLGTYRDVEVGRQHPLERGLRDLNREGLIEEIAVRRFDREGTAALTATTFGYGEISPEFAELLHRHTEGNPFFTHEVLRALVERGDLYQANGRWERRTLEEIEVPRSIRSAVGERLSRLSDVAQEVLTEASVLGQTFAFDDLQALGDRSEDTIEAALEEASAAGLVRAAGHDEYGFNHALTQQVLYEEIPPHRRRRLHLAAGAALERGKHPERRAAELAYHFLQGDDAGQALRYSLLAGEEAYAVYASSESARHFRTAIELAVELDDQSAEASGREGVGRALYRQSVYEESVQELLHADRLYASLGDREGRRRSVATALAACRNWGLSRPDVDARVVALLSDDEPSRALAQLLTELATIQWSRGEMEESLRSIERASKIAQAVGAGSVRAMAEARRGTVLGALDRPDAIPVLEEAIRLAEETGDLFALGLGLNNLAFYFLVAGELELALQYKRRALAVAEQANWPVNIAWGHMQVGLALHYLGRIAEARASVERALDIFGTIEPSWHTTYAYLQMGAILRDEGRFEEAEAWLDRALPMAEGSKDAQGLSYYRDIQGTLDLLLDRPERVVERREVASTGHEDGERLVAAEAYARLGAESQAEELITEFLEQDRLYTSAALRVRGILHAGRGEWEEAQADRLRALEHARRTHYRLEEGRALTELGRLQAQRGDATAAADRFAQALAVFRDMGADAWAHTVEQAQLDLLRH